MEFFDLTQSGQQVQEILNHAAQLPTNEQLNGELAKKYEKPGSGIPLSDMTEEVQEKLSKAASAVVKAINTTWAQLKTLRDGGTLVPGQWYRITDFVTTVNPYTNQNARSAAHAFDVLVMALSASVLCEDAYAVLHSGDTYFASSKLEAWQLRYTIDNVQWSLKAGIYATDSEGYSFVKEGTIEVDGTTYILWKGDAMFSEDWADYAVSVDENVDSPMYAYYGPDDFDPEDPEETGTIATVITETNNGKGTILWMKDEFGNECAYDFKNVQFKRWKVTDSMSGRTGFTDTYMCGDVNNTPANLSVEDETDFIWAYTFSSDNTGGEQIDYSLDGTHNVYGNVIKEMGDGSLNNNVLFGEGNYSNTFSQNCSYNSFSKNCYGNSFSQNCWYNSFSQNCYGNSFSQNCYGNSFSQGCQNNSFSQGCQNNSFSQNCNSNSFSQNCNSNSFSQYCQFNSFSQNCSYNSFSQNCNSNSFSQNVNHVTLGTNYMQNIEIGAGNQYITLTCSASATAQQPCKNVKVNMGVNNTTTNKAIAITTKNQAYQTVVASENDALIEV